MNFAKYVIPLCPPSKGEKDCCYPFLCQEIGRSRILFPPSKGEGTDFTITECVDLFLFPPSKGDYGG